MKRLLILRIAFISMIAFTIAGGYFWYIYFDQREGKMLSDNVRLQLLNNGSITYLNAVPKDDDGNIPVYYFRVKNNLNEEASYVLEFQEVSPSVAQDGCSSDTFLNKNELSYELRLDNKLIKSGKLDNLKDNVLDSNKVLGNNTNDYSLKIYIADDSVDTLKKHYHYSVVLREQNESIS